MDNEHWVRHIIKMFGHFDIRNVKLNDVELLEMLLISIRNQWWELDAYEIGKTADEIYGINLREMKIEKYRDADHAPTFSFGSDETAFAFIECFARQLEVYRKTKRLR